MGGAILDGVVKECLCKEVTFEWRPELQQASHTLGPRGLQKMCSGFKQNRAERASINIKGQGVCCVSTRERKFSYILSQSLFRILFVRWYFHSTDKKCEAH